MRFVCAVVVGWAAFSLAGCGEGVDDDDDLDPDLQTQLSNVRQFIKARDEDSQHLQEMEEMLWLQEQKHITCATVKEQERKRRDVLFQALEQQLDFTRKCGDVSLDEGGEMVSTNNNTRKQWGAPSAKVHVKRIMDSWTQHKCHYDHKERGYQKTIDPGILGLPRLKAAACDLWIRVHESSITKAMCNEDPTLSKEHQQQAEDYLKMINKIHLPEMDLNGDLKPLPVCGLPKTGPNQRQTSGRRGGSRRNARGFASARVEASGRDSLTEVENVSMASRANANATAESATVTTAQSPGSWFQSFSLKTARDASNENAVRGMPPKRPKHRDEMSRRAVATNPAGALGRL